MGNATIVQQLRAARKRGVPPRFATPGRVGSGREAAIVVAVDHGNDALKAAVLGRGGTLHTIRVPAAHAVAQEIRAGQGETAYRVDDGRWFWMGEAALEHGGEDLPVGPTAQRIVDGRLQAMIAATLVEILSVAGYPPGTYAIVLGFAIPNTEIVRVPQASGAEAMGVSPAARAALKAHLSERRWTVERNDPDGGQSMWRIEIAMVIPQAQSTGALFAYTRTPEGTPSTDLDAIDVLDIGGGDLQHTEITLHPRYQMLTERRGDGTIRIAEALRQAFPALGLTIIAAQQALITRTLLVAGRRRDISGEVAQLLASHGQAIITDMLPVLRQSRRFVLVTGGGVVLLRDLLTERLAAESKTPGQEYDLIDADLASSINAIGMLFASIVLAHAARREGP